MLKRSLVTISLMVAVLLMCAQRTASSESRTDLGNMPANGIVVSDVKVYNDQSLQTLLNSLKGRLGQLSGLDQTTLIKAEGSLQGSSARQLEFSMQGSGTPLPGSTTTSSKPGIQTQVTSPTVTPTSPALPNAPSLSPSSNYSQSALNILNEQMQLSYETINLQMLLEGSLSDQYSRGKNIRKRHVTLGFPISITVPNKHSGLWGQVYTGAVAEVEITVCNLPDKGRKKTQEPQEPPRIQELPKTEEPPSLMTILPREKTYNVATISNNLASLGASAIVAGVANIGASFLWAHQTYYLVQDQDTVAFQRSCEPRKCQSCCTFVWQFHPVLGEKTVRQGLRQTFAQISFPTSVDVRGLEKVSDSIGEVTVTTRWRQYDRKTGIVGDVLPGAEVTFPPSKIANFDKSPDQPGLVIVDGHDGTITVTAWGNYQSRTRVRIGSLFLDESTPGFHQTVDYIKFIAPAQALALNGASFVSPTGLQTDIHYSWRDVSEEYNGHGVDLALVGDNLVEVIVPKGSLKVPKDCKGNSKDLTEVLDECNKAFIEANLRGSQYKEELSGPFPLILYVVFDFAETCVFVKQSQCAFRCGLFGL